MERISLQSDAPSYVKVWEISQELLDFTNVLEKNIVQ
jgi:hypothetical protein